MANRLGGASLFFALAVLVLGLLRLGVELLR
jgi:hypothetical protein